MRHLVCRVLFEKQKFPKSRSSVKAVRLKHNLAASPILSDIPATSSRIELECSGTAVVGAKDDSPLTSSLPSLSAVAHEHLRPRRLSPFGVECLSRGRTPSSAARRIGHLEMAGKGLGQGETAAGFWPPSGRPSKPFRVGLYGRVSTHEQQTIPLQTRAMRQYATRGAGPSPCKSARWVPGRRGDNLVGNCWRRRAAGKSMGCCFGGWIEGGSVTDLPYSKAASPQSHSYLSATTGSTREARCAGTYPANTAAATINKAAPAMVSGSFGLSPNRRVEIRRVASSEAITPYTPMQPITSASTPKKPVRRANKRSWKSV